VTIGTLGIRTIEGLSYMDACYLTSMIATGQGPNYTPVTALGKVFTENLGIVSVETVIATLVFLFGSFSGAVLRSGIEKIEEKSDREMEEN